MTFSKNRKIVLISYANEAYKQAQRLQTQTAKIAGFTDVIAYGPEDIEEAFKKEHKDIFQYKRGDGLWLWKPYLIKKTLDNMRDGEILFYCDSGACFFRNVKGIISKLSSQDVWISVLPLKEKQFTKRQTFDIMNCNSEKYKETAQISGTFCAFKKSELSTKFVDEWLQYCCNIDALEPPKDINQEATYYYGHREDQSILSLLVKKIIYKRGLIRHNMVGCRKSIKGMAARCFIMENRLDKRTIRFVCYTIEQKMEIKKFCLINFYVQFFREKLV